MARTRTETRDGVYTAITEPTTDEERGRFRLIEDWADENGAPIQRYTHADGRSEMWRCAHNGQGKQRLKDDGTTPLPEGEPVPAGVKLVDEDGEELDGIERDRDGIPLAAQEVGGWRVWSEPTENGRTYRARVDSDGLMEFQAYLPNGMPVDASADHAERAGQSAELWDRTADALRNAELGAAAKSGSLDPTYNEYVQVGGTPEAHEEWVRRCEERRAGRRTLAAFDGAAVRADVERAEREREAWAVIGYRQQLEAERDAIRGQRVLSDEQIVRAHRIDEALAELPNPPRPAGKPPSEIEIEDLSPEQLRAVYGSNSMQPEPAEATA